MLLDIFHLPYHKKTIFLSTVVQMVTTWAERERSSPVGEGPRRVRYQLKITLFTLDFYIHCVHEKTVTLSMFENLQNQQALRNYNLTA